MRLPSTMPGLTASKSCQRRPLPKFCRASFQRESPRLTVTTFNFAAAAGGEGAARRRQVLEIFQKQEEPSDFSSPAPERDPPARESEGALDPRRCTRVWIFLV